MTPEWITPAEAAERAEVGPKCMSQWCVRYGIGKKVGGRWRIDPAALDRLLAGERPAATEATS